ncbi:MAG: Yip1 family protein [Pyrinomonadaceae bacterium]
MEQNESENPQPTPPAKKSDVSEPPQMSEIASVGNVFFEPGNVFDDMRRKPRFLIAGLIVLATISIFQVAFVEKIGYKEIVKSRIESSSSTRDMDKAQKSQIVEQQGSDMIKYSTYAATPVVVALVFLIGGLLYWGMSSAMGGSGKFLGGLSVWVYSSLPPAIVFTLANLIVLFLKSTDDIDIANSQNGLVKANPSFFVDATANPVLAAVLGAVDLFAIWGWILAAIGLQRVFKLSSGAAWAVVLIFALIGVGGKVVGALFF